MGPKLWKTTWPGYRSTVRLAVRSKNLGIAFRARVLRRFTAATGGGRYFFNRLVVVAVVIGGGRSDSMGMPEIEVMRDPLRLTPDPSRVIVRPFIPGDCGRVPSIVDRVLCMSDSTVSSHLGALLEKYASRHACLYEAFEQHFEEVRPHIGNRGPLSVDRCRLLGAYFTKEYALESVALFNPSMVLHPDQDGMRSGQARFIMSLRACGEGHISSIEFRTGVINEAGRITMDAPTPFAASRRPVDDRLYDKARFRRKLVEMGAYNPLADGIIDAMRDQFTSDEFNRVMDAFSPADGFRDTFAELAEMMRWLVHSTYHLRFSPTTVLSERVIFPVTENESRGIEDARFVRFVDDDGTITFFATYTAYNGFKTLPQFLETTDFCHFKIFTFNGSCAQNKGQALFPRKIRGDYWMVSRLDGEKMYLLWSDNIHFWNDGKALQAPVEPWEFVQIGNCGSPIETDEGWLVLTHGVGPMRQYWLGAMLLDLDDPFRVIGRLKHPLLMPTEEEQNGYVPNVLYSCGAVVHHDRLIIPYAAADTSTSVATVSLSDLLAHLRR